MKKSQIILLPLLISASMMSCKTSAILTSTFESQTIGNLPAKNIPGDPTGDVIDYSSELEPRIRVTASATAGAKAVTFTEIATPGLTAHNQNLSFRGISTDFTQPMWFLFTGTHSGTGDRLLIDITDGAAGMIARMFLDQSGNLSLVTALPGTEQVVGNIGAGVVHTLLVGLNLSQKKFNLTIFKSGGNITLTDRPVLNDNILAYANPAHPTIHFRYESGSSATRKYVLESVGITKKKPSM